MTEKRFTVDEGLENVLCWEINDKENEDMTCGECAKLLNELNDDKNDLIDALFKAIDENEQLKQRNDRQADSLGRLYKLIEQKDWRALSDIMDDFKRCDEQLQREWETYGDVE